jgi:hypothetical protein
MNLGDLSRYWPIVLAVSVAVLILVAWRLDVWWHRRPSPAEIERQRRALINSIGKMGDGVVLEVLPSLVSYSYYVRGIEYFASQDVSALESVLPADQWAMVGPVSVKYDPRNPANSIVVSEQWTGVRRAKSST